MAVKTTLDVITPQAAGGTLAGLFRERVRRSPDKPAYHQYDATAGEWRQYTWWDMARETARWQAGLIQEGLQAGDRVAVLLRNSREWVLFDQAALGCGLVVVPLYTDDRADNIAYIVRDAGIKLLLIQGQLHWKLLQPVWRELDGLACVLSLQPLQLPSPEPRLRHVPDWLPASAPELLDHDGAPDTLATIVYTSGTTGRPKGVMLSHRNILWNAHASQRAVSAFLEDEFLSFLPLSHTFERTVGYYLTMLAGATVCYARSIPDLPDDLQTIRPTVLISVPRIYERIYNRVQSQLEEKSPLARALFRTALAAGWRRFDYRQGRAAWSPVLLLWPLLRRIVADKVLGHLGGRLRLAVCGGAPLPPTVAQFFISLGLPVIQGYGLTETSPVVCANLEHDNDPASVGVALDDVQVRIGEQDELLVKSPGIMLGYWNNAEATAEIIDADGWLHTGDKVRIENGHIYITGRLKDILVLSNGEKIPPADMEMALSLDPLFDQAMVIGDNRPYLSALLVLNRDRWQGLAAKLGLNPDDADALRHRKLLEFVLARVADCLREFPGYAQIRQVACSLEPWTVEAGLITPTLKLKRDRILERFREIVDELYAGH